MQPLRRLAFFLALSAPLAVLLHPAHAQASERASTALPNVRLLEAMPMPGLARERRLRLYLPGSYASEPTRRYPVIYMHDGQNLFDDRTSFAGEWGVDETLQGLERSHGFEAIVVGIDNGGGRRMNEMSPWAHPKIGAAEGEAYARFIVDVVKPWIDGHYRTQPEREQTALIGSSMGGLITHYMLLRYPDVFAKAAVFSPSYWFSEQSYDYSQQRALPADSRLYLYAGGAEDATMVPNLQRMLGLMREVSADAALTLQVEPRAQHKEAAWRRQLPAALVWLFELKPAAKP